jgi:hypothetical protein
MLPVSQPKQGSSHTVIWHYPGFCMEGLDKMGEKRKKEKKRKEKKRKKNLGVVLCPGVDSNQGSAKHK